MCLFAGQEVDYAFNTLDRDQDGVVTEEVRVLLRLPATHKQWCSGEADNGSLPYPTAQCPLPFPLDVGERGSESSPKSKASN